MYTGSIPVVASNTLIRSITVITDPAPTKSAEELKRERVRDYWLAPLDASPFKRLNAWMSMLFVDHGIIRLAFPNRHKLSEDVWRSSQPSPGQIKWFAEQGGKTILTLRGTEYRGAFALERETTQKLGIKLIHSRCRSDRIVPVREIKEIIRLLRTIETPLLIHCKSGADRMGFVSVLYRHLIMGDPMEVAVQQLSGRYLHLKGSRTGVLDHFFEIYLEEYRKTGIDFETWLDTKCRPEEINRSFVPKGFAAWFEEVILKRE